MARKTQKQFIEEVELLCEIGTTVTSEYINASTKVELTCGSGHTRNIIPSNLLSRGNGTVCKVCLGITSFSKQYKPWNPEDLSYLFEHYENTSNKIICDKLNRSINSVAMKASELGLIKIDNIGKRLTLEEVNNRVSALYPEISVLDYVHSREASTIFSKKCKHSWKARTNNILSKHSGFLCPECYPACVSVAEKELLEFIKTKYTGWILENDRTCIKPLELDIVLPDLGLAIEYNGLYYHSDEYKPASYHNDKTKALKNNMDYRLIHVNSDEWLNKKDIVKSRISVLLGSVARREYARKCTVKEINYPRDFLDTNHLQGAGSPTSINLGLFKGEELLSVMTFSKPRFTTDKEYELVRFCSLLNTSIIGGASKLLKHFKAHYTGSIISYSDRRWSEGSLYKKLGFTFSHTSVPNYRYYKGSTSLSRYQCQKHKLKELFPSIYEESKTEASIMSEAGYFKVYDCGNDVWVMP